MSSPSSATDQPVDHQAALTEALAEVGGLSFFGFVEPMAEEYFTELAAAETDWVTATVAFKGGFSGTVHCALPTGLARELVAAFSGDSESAEGDGPLDDLMGEFTNMVCGSWLSRACSRQVFSLSSPQVVRRPGGWTLGPFDGATAVLASLNDRPVALWMTAEAQ